LRGAPPMKRLRQYPWIGLSLDTWRLGIESSCVIGLRTLKMVAGGPAGASEAKLMVDEKITAGLALQAKAMSGALGATPAAAAAATLAHYRRKVRANWRRLSRVG
jgi:hypothetical protein